MIVNWKVIAALLGIAIFYEVLVVFLWFGLKWMITPFIKPGLKLFIDYEIGRASCRERV